MHHQRWSVFDALALLALAGLWSAVAQPMLAADRDRARRGKDAAQIRQIHVALTSWAASRNGQFPLPSTLDVNHTTVPGTLGGSNRHKDTTGNIFSILIFNTLMTPEDAVSPAESSGQITVDAGFQYTNPQRATLPAQALWDPGFAGTPADPFTRRNPGIGNFSYAHLLPFAQRQPRWSTTTDPALPLLSNRGPVFAGAISDSAPFPASGWRLVSSPSGVSSNTLLFFPPRNAWVGHVLLADGSVLFATRPDPHQIRYTRTGQPAAVNDNLFVNESDDATRIGSGLAGTNAHMRQISSVTGSDATLNVTLFRD